MMPTDQPGSELVWKTRRYFTPIKILLFAIWGIGVGPLGLPSGFLGIGFFFFFFFGIMIKDKVKSRTHFLNVCLTLLLGGFSASSQKKKKSWLCEWPKPLARKKGNAAQICKEKAINFFIFWHAKKKGLPLAVRDDKTGYISNESNRSETFLRICLIL